MEDKRGSVEEYLNKVMDSHAPIQRTVEEARRLDREDHREGLFILLRGMRAGEGDESLPYSGLHMEDQSPNITLSLTSNFPGVVSLAAALAPNSRHLYSLLGSVCHGCEHELHFSTLHGFTFEAAMNVASLFVYALRLRSACDFSAVAWSNRPWATIAASQGGVDAGLLGKEWIREGGLLTGVVSEKDFQWTEDNFLVIARLHRESKQFRVAFEAVGDGAFLHNRRSALAAIWGGIEALFAVSQELSYKLSMYMAVLTYEDPVSRSTQRQLVKNQYAIRSKAVHGASMSDEILLEATRTSWQLLSSAIQSVVELGRVPSAQEFDDALLGSPLLSSKKEI